MAVTKIRRLSSWILIACTIITLVILGLFYLGGSGEKYKGEYWNPNYIGLLLQWQYVLFVITALSLVFFGIWQFISSFRTNPKGGLMGLAVLVLFGGMLFISYIIGSGDPLSIMNEDAQKYNVPFWLKLTDMWLYSTYILVALIVLAILGGSVKKVMNK